MESIYVWVNLYIIITMIQRREFTSIRCSWNNLLRTEKYLIMLYTPFYLLKISIRFKTRKYIYRKSNVSLIHNLNLASLTI